MFKKVVQRGKERFVESTKEKLDEHSDEIADFVIDAAALCFVCGFMYSVGQNLIPKRNNVHIYLHVR